MPSLRKEIGSKVRELRKGRRWTQAELAQRLDLSQGRLSEIERGDGSFSAEHLLHIFRLFNVDPSYFASAKTQNRQDDQLWNAVARLGASHLVENDRVLPSQRLQEVHDILREALVRGGSPRLLTALAPVLVAHANELQLRVVESQLLPLGLSHRLGWLVENTLFALRELSQRKPSPATVAQYRRATVVLSSWLEALRPESVPATQDVLDASIRSDKSRAFIERHRSPISARWGVVSEIGPDDFGNAIEAANEPDR